MDLMILIIILTRHPIWTSDQSRSSSENAKDRTNSAAVDQ